MARSKSLSWKLYFSFVIINRNFFLTKSQLIHCRN